MIGPDVYIRFLLHLSNLIWRSRDERGMKNFLILSLYERITTRMSIHPSKIFFKRTPIFPSSPSCERYGLPLLCLTSESSCPRWILLLVWFGLGSSQITVPCFPQSKLISCRLDSESSPCPSYGAPCPRHGFGMRGWGERNRKWSGSWELRWDKYVIFEVFKLLGKVYNNFRHSFVEELFGFQNSMRSCMSISALDNNDFPPCFKLILRLS